MSHMVLLITYKKSDDNNFSTRTEDTGVGKHVKTNNIWIIMSHFNPQDEANPNSSKLPYAYQERSQ